MEKFSKPKETIKSSQFWRYSEAAAKSGLWDEFWEKDLITQAWIVATIETEELLKRVVSFVNNPPEVPGATADG